MCKAISFPSLEILQFLKAIFSWNIACIIKARYFANYFFNCLEFSQALSCYDEAMQTQQKSSIAQITRCGYSFHLEI